MRILCYYTCFEEFRSTRERVVGAATGGSACGATGGSACGATGGSAVNLPTEILISHWCALLRINLTVTVWIQNIRQAQTRARPESRENL